ERRGRRRLVLLDPVEQADLDRPRRVRGDEGPGARAGGRRARARRCRRAGRAVYRLVSRAGVVPGSSGGEELEGAAMPASFFTRMAPIQATLAARRLTTLPRLVD